MLSQAKLNTIRKEVGGATDPLTAMFSALSDAGRYKIFRLFMKRRDLCVTEVAAVLNISVPAASQQLRIMESSGLVVKERQGQKICYAVKREDGAVRSLMRIVNQA